MNSRIDENLRTGNTLRVEKIRVVVADNHSLTLSGVADSLAAQGVDVVGQGRGDSVAGETREISYNQRAFTPINRRAASPTGASRWLLPQRRLRTWWNRTG